MAYENDSRGFEGDTGSGAAVVETARPALRLRIPRPLRAILRGWASAGYPQESCGLLIGEARSGELAVREVRRAANLERSRPADRYVLDPEDFLDADHAAREAGLEVLGFWHSHPDSPAIPSETDRASAWAGYAYVIVSVDADRVSDVRVWSLEDGTFQEGKVVE